ncbi:MAG: lytic transglycosylase F, partial [Proteobacteria bacterium]|nr:lytic transglycosylase F [Pseudomonadota bacterium]
VQDRVIRFLIPYSKTFYFLDGVRQRGLSYEGAKEFENYVNALQKTKHLKIHVLIIPTPREKLLSDLDKGLGDIAIGNLTITDERRKLVDFSDPFLTDVDEVLVTEKNGPLLKDVFALAGKAIYVRKSSSYYGSLTRLNKTLVATGKTPVKIVFADENLEDEDLLEMLNAGLLSMLIVDKHKAEFWGGIFDNIKVHPEIKVNSGGEIAWALRKNSPELMRVVNAFVKKNKKGTLHGNIAFNRYLKETKYVTNAKQADDRKRFLETVEYFKTYGKKYDFDYLMLAALAYQESRLDQNAKSHVGAVGVMQILPSTARDKNVGIHNIHEVEANIHAGTKYLRFMADRYFVDGSINKVNKMLFAFASYNAGPGKVAQLRKEAVKMGLDPDIWFRNVEVVAAKRIGRETVQYVSNIYKYYVVYKLLAEQEKF